MSLPVSISERAETDLTHQYLWYLEHADADVAERFLAAFDATVYRLAEQPLMGKRRRFRAQELAGMRSLAVAGPFGAYLIFYRAGSSVVSIERVMHGARDLPRRLLEPPNTD
jgi:plasmid stabilization system protein ParE